MDVPIGAAPRARKRAREQRERSALRRTAHGQGGASSGALSCAPGRSGAEAHRGGGASAPTAPLSVTDGGKGRQSAAGAQRGNQKARSRSLFRRARGEKALCGQCAPAGLPLPRWGHADAPQRRDMTMSPPSQVTRARAATQAVPRPLPRGAAGKRRPGLVWNLYSILTPAPILQYFTQYSAPSAPILKP